ncbi:hypothetical protein PGTUg99_023491 [Puccinia graminis f. sp. tritici]|uniref:Uncharacterized protein n=1 Tax=Puccinia graminis f. sp. tritici TaxID=56615 RepID=A0A5B0RMF9_PUCGR|nr:hypothetical protein PGTUg99_023491 [Puccinia graminis f. sp. tritici]
MHPHPDRRRFSSGLVLRGFKSLARDHGPSSFQYDNSIQELYTLENINWKRDHWDRLRSNLLPLIEQQLITLSQFLEPNHLQKEPEFTFNLIVGVQSQLVQTFDQIRSAILILWPKLPEELQSNRINDQEFKELKRFRVRGLHRMITEEVLPEFNKLFRCSYHLITGTQARSSLQHKRITIFTSSSRNAIKRTIVWLERSECEFLVQNYWQKDPLNCNERLEQLSILITRGAFDPQEPNGQVLNKRAMGLAKSIIPIIKLSRLFFKNLARWASKQTQLPLFTGMRSDQLETLSKTHEAVADCLNKFTSFLSKVVTDNRRACSGDFANNLTTLKAHYEAVLFLVSFYLIPLIPDTDRSRAYDHFQDLFRPWSHQFSLAVVNLLDASKLI